MKLQFKNTSRIGYLTGRVIREIAKSVSCQESSDVIFLDQKYIQRRNKEIFVSDLKQVKWTKIKIGGDNIEINTHHPEAIMSSTNELEMFFELEKRMIGEHVSFIEPVADEVANSIIDKYIEEVKEKVMEPFRAAKNYIYMIGTIIMGVIITCITLCLICKTNCCGVITLCGYCLKRRRNSRRYMTYNNKRRDDQVKEIIFMDDEKESHKELTENQRLKRLF